MEIKTILINSLKLAQKTSDIGKTKGEINRDRSKRFIENLGVKFRKFYSSDESIKIFTKHFTGNKKEFGLNELLYDLLICETNTANSLHGKPLNFVTKALWQVESELAKDTRQSIFDFNKLIIGAGDNKLFIGPQVKDQEKYISLLGDLAKYCSGNVFLALITHPVEWEKQLSVKYWKFEKDKWLEI